MAPSPPRRGGLPLLGNAHQFARDPFAFLESLSTVDEDVVRVDLGGTAYVACSPAAVRTILVDEHDAFERATAFVDDLDPLIGQGLLTVQDRQWRAQRTTVGPAFFPDRIRDYGETIRSVTREQFDGDEDGKGWRDGDRVDVTREAREIAVEVVSRTLLGTSLRDRIETIHDISDATIDHYEVSVANELLPGWVPTPKRRRFAAAMDDLDAIVDDVIAAHRGEAATDGDLVSLALSGEAGGSIGREEVRDLVRVFLLAGADTTALAMSNALCLLAQHPQVLTEVRAELDRELGDADPTSADLRNLPRLDAVIKETIRLYPSAFAVYRQPRDDVEVTGYALEAGRMVIVPQWAIHRDERFFDDPHAFRPSRWQEPSHPDYAYFPFGAGPFTCIGNRLASTEARLVVAMAVQRFDLEHVAGDVSDRRAAITTQPTEHLVLDVRRRAQDEHRGTDHDDGRATSLVTE